MRFTKLAFTKGVLDYAIEVGIIKQNGPYFTFDGETFLGKINLRKAITDKNKIDLLTGKIILYLKEQQFLDSSLPILERVRIKHEIDLLLGCKTESPVYLQDQEPTLASESAIER